jgi:hypothetical protein
MTVVAPADLSASETLRDWPPGMFSCLVGVAQSDPVEIEVITTFTG